MGHIYCRLLNYDEALKCYDRTLQLDPENLNIEIRRISVALCITKGTQEMGNIQRNLDTLLCKIDQSWSDPHRETIPFANCLEVEEMRQLLKVLLLASSCFECDRYSELAEIILLEDATLRKYSDIDYMMLFAFGGYKLASFRPMNNMISTVASLIDEEGVSTKCILWLNTLGKFLLCNMNELDSAYHCFRRALNMERLLYQTKPNMNMMTSLHFLGLTSFYLSKRRESKFYFESLLQLFESFGRPDARLVDVKTAYWHLAMVSRKLGDSAEECVCFLEKGLKATTESPNDTQLYFDCKLYSGLATIWHAEHNQEQASKFVLKGKICLRKIVGIARRVNATCDFAETLATIQRINEGIEILKEEVQVFTSQTKEKALCLMKLGELCVNQGLSSDAENYYKEALKIFGEMQDNTSDILECNIGMSKAIMMDNRVSEAKKVSDQALDLAIKLHANSRVFWDMGIFCEKLGYTRSARQWFDAGLRSCKELSIVAKDAWVMEIALILKFGKLLGKDACAIDSVNLETAMQAQRRYYDCAVEALRQYVDTKDVDSVTVEMFLLVAEEYSAVDENETIKLLLEALDVSEIVYGKDIPNEMVIDIYDALSKTYFTTGEIKDGIKYSELVIKMEMDLNLSNLFCERIAEHLKRLAFSSLEYPVSIDTVEYVYEFLFFAQKNRASTDSTAETVAARCFTCLGILFYTLGEWEKAENSVHMASQLFSDNQERKKLPFEKTCEIMKEILSSKKVLAWDKKKIQKFIVEEAFDALERKGTLAEDSRTLENCSNDRENVELFIPTSDDVKRQEIDCSDLTVDLLTKVVSQINLAVQVESFPDASLNPESSSLEVKERVLGTHLEYNRRKGNVHPAAKMQPHVEALQLSLNTNYSYDAVEKRISDAIRAKEANDPSSCITSLDFVLQLAFNWKQKTNILKLRAECYLSRGDFRTAAINFSEAVRVYSNETVRSRDELCEYLEMAIGLIKAEILCQNVAVAWFRYCIVATQLVSYHEHEESLILLVIELHYLGANCLYVLLEITESKDFANVRFVCQQAFLLLNKHQQKVVTLKLLKHKNWFFEVSLFYMAVLRKLDEEEEADKILRLNLKSLNNPNVQLEFRHEICRLHSNIGRIALEDGQIEQSMTWLDKSLGAFFSAAFPDMLSFYEELLPLLQAITVTKTSGTSNKSRSPFQQAVDMCKDVLVKQGNDLNYVYKFLKTLANLYMALGRTKEAIVVAETGLEICNLMGDNNVTDQINDRARMLLYLAQMHQLNSTNSAFDKNMELNLAEWYYQTDQDSTAEFVLQKNLSYANFLCEQKRFTEAGAVLQNMNNLGKELSNKLVYFTYFSRVFYGPGIQKSVEIDGELLSTVEHCMYSAMVRVFVGIGKKREAVAACEKLADNPVVVHDAICGKRPSSTPYLIEACHHELLFLLSDGDQKRLQNYELPLSAANIFELYYMLNEYSLALKYYPNETQSPELIEMKISCLRLAGNELVELDRADESDSYFTHFLQMLQAKEGFLDKPFHAQCATLAGYSFANQYYILRSLGSIMASRGGNLDGAIQCFERCLELDEDLTFGQDPVATLAELYQSKALTADKENQDFYKRQMNLALDLFQKLLQKTAEIEPFVEYSFGSLLLKLERYDEAVEHFEDLIYGPDDEDMRFLDVDKSLVDVYFHREIEATGSIDISVKVCAFYELISTYMKLNEVGKAQEVALRLENYVERLPLIPETFTELSIVGYANTLIGNKQKAAEIFYSVLEIKPGHLPVAEALESLCL